MKLIQIIAIIQVILCIIIFIAIYVKDNYQRKKRCNVTVKGKLIERYTTEIRRTYSHPKFHGYETFIVIEYEYNQEFYSTLVRISPFSNLKIHDTVELKINPTNPKETYKIYIPEDLKEQLKKRPTKNEKITDIIFKIIILTPIVAIICFIVFVAVVLIFNL